MLKTIKQNLQAKNIDKVDCEALLQFVLAKPRSYLYTWPEKYLSQAQQKTFEQLCQQRIDGQPIAYLIGEKEFYSRSFKVNQHTLIPRPETELLIDKALEQIESMGSESLILDLGTGSGIIAITLSKETGLTIDACDISTEALTMAKQNAKTLTAKVSFHQSNWFENIPKKQYNLIVSNPPYIEEADKHLKQGDLRFEPLFALASGKQGFDDIKTITQQSKNYLKPNGMLILEHGYKQKQGVQAILKEQGFDEIKTFKDYNQLDRTTQAVLKK